MKKLIALQGTANRGKTSSIKIVYGLIKKQWPKAIIDELNVKSDIKVVMTINGKKIGIESQGDPGSRLPESLDYFVQIGCDVIICATRTRGETVQAVKGLEDKYEICWLLQKNCLKTNKQMLINKAMSERIVNELNKALLA
ncbi:MAG: hypothetical protein ABIJ40_20830 [Bacteroidota bacterium]